MFSACNVAKALERFIPEFMQLEHKSRVWKVRETSATDIIIAAPKFLPDFQVSVDASREYVTGADFELLVRFPSKQCITFFVQCKRADYSSDPKKNKNPGWSYKELFHPRSTGQQVSQIIKYCKLKKDRVPLYAFFHSTSALKYLGVGATGICLVDASIIENESKKIRKIRSAKHYKKSTFPFHRIFCLAASSSPDCSAFIAGLAEFGITKEVESREYSDDSLSKWLNHSDIGTEASHARNPDEIQSCVRMIYNVGIEVDGLDFV